MDVDQYISVFIEENEENLQTINANLLAIEQEPTNLSYVNDIFRAAHTLKGMAATMGFEDLSNLTHHMENVLDAIRHEHISATPEVLDTVFDSVEHLEEIVTDIANGGDGKRDVSDIVTLLEQTKSAEFISDINQRAHQDTNDTTKDLNSTSTDESANPSVDLKSNSLPVFDEYEQAVMEQAMQEGFFIYHIQVTLQKECLLKGARVYMVFQTLENHGEILQTQPPVEQLEEEQFDDSFTVTFSSKETQENIETLVTAISEIEHVHIQTLSKEVLRSAEQNGAQQTSVKKETTSTGKNEEIPSAQKEGTQNEGAKNKGAQNKDAQNKTSSPANTNTKVSTYTQSLRVNIERVDQLMNSFEELLIHRGRLEQLARENEDTESIETLEQMSRVSNHLQDIILSMRMVPIEQVFNRFPKMVRSLSKDLGKKVNLHITGADTELDRTVIDQMGDPLVHLIRNSIDHGLEAPEKRRQTGKPETGEIHLKAYHSGNRVIIDIEDDGAGIDREKVVQKALKKGVITEEEKDKLTESHIDDLLFASGFSTADQVSDVSGRGVGLDVVKNTIESLGGTIRVSSTPGEGSIFSIELPLTLSIIQALLVNIGHETYALPLSSVIETVKINSQDIRMVHHQKVMTYRESVLPIISLREAFGLPSTDQQMEDYAVIVHKGDQMVTLLIDSFVGQQEIVIKSLGQYLSHVFAISGATILGDGQVALIIDSNAFIR